MRDKRQCCLKNPHVQQRTTTKGRCCDTRLCAGICCATRDGAVSSDGNVPNGNWNPDNRQLKFNRNDADNRNPNGGFRLSVKVLSLNFCVYSANLRWHRLSRPGWTDTAEPANSHFIELLHSVTAQEEMSLRQQFLFVR